MPCIVLFELYIHEGKEIILSVPLWLIAIQWLHQFTWNRFGWIWTISGSQPNYAIQYNTNNYCNSRATQALSLHARFWIFRLARVFSVPLPKWNFCSNYVHTLLNRWLHYWLGKVTMWNERRYFHCSTWKNRTMSQGHVTLSCAETEGETRCSIFHTFVRWLSQRPKITHNQVSRVRTFFICVVVWFSVRMERRRQVNGMHDFRIIIYNLLYHVFWFARLFLFLIEKQNINVNWTHKHRTPIWKTNVSDGVRMCWNKNVRRAETVRTAKNSIFLTAEYSYSSLRNST